MGASLPEHCFHRAQDEKPVATRSYNSQGKEESTPSTICREEEVCSVTTPSSVAELTPPAVVTKISCPKGSMMFAERVKEVSPTIPSGVRSATASLSAEAFTCVGERQQRQPLIQGVRSAEASRRLFQSPQAPQGADGPCFFPESVRSEYERKLLRLALRRYREDLQAQIHSAEEVMKDLSPVRPSQAMSTPSAFRSSRSISPEAFSRWPSMAVPQAQQRPTWKRHSQGVSPPANFAPSPDSQQLEAKQALELALQEAQAPPAPPAPPVPQAPQRLDPRTRLQEKQERRVIPSAQRAQRGESGGDEWRPQPCFQPCAHGAHFRRTVAGAVA